MKRSAMLAAASVVLLGLAIAVTAAEEGNGAAQTKTGTVTMVDLVAKKIVVMVTRELAFTVTDATKIVQGGEARKLDDIKVDAKVAVEYTREGDTRTATKIVILGDKAGEGKKAAAGSEGKAEVQTKTGTVTKVDVAAKQIVVLVTRELTFTVTDATRIVQGDEARKLADIKVDAKVAVDYTRQGDTRTATKIAIVGSRVER